MMSEFSILILYRVCASKAWRESFSISVCIAHIPLQQCKGMLDMYDKLKIYITVIKVILSAYLILDLFSLIVKLEVVIYK